MTSTLRASPVPGFNELSGDCPHLLGSGVLAGDQIFSFYRSQILPMCFTNPPRTDIDATILTQYILMIFVRFSDFNF
jgi:hypothetical protein